MEIKIPNNLEECFTALDDMNAVDIEMWLKSSENEAIGMSHHGLGMWLRNNWGLWSGSPLKTFFENLGLHHADDMSGVILTSYHRHKNNKDINLDKQVQHYKDYWEHYNEQFG